jgi:hypothetical protein
MHGGQHVARKGRLGFDTAPINGQGLGGKRSCAAAASRTRGMRRLVELGRLGLVLFARLSSMASLGFAVASPTLLVDVDRGQVLYKRQSTANWCSASLTKLMTVYGHDFRDVSAPFVRVIEILLPLNGLPTPGLRR